MSNQEMRIQQKITPGDVLIKEEPFVFVLSSKVHSLYCDHCFKKDKLLKCSGCHYVHYCGKLCQREAWSIHKQECVSMKRTLPKVVPDAARLLARLIRKLQKGGDLVKAYYTEGNFRMFKDLMSHYTDIKENSKKMEHFVSLCGVLQEFLGGSSVPNTAELMGMFGRMCVNSFNICDEELVSMGTGIYLGASVIDHSCQPNAVATFEGTTLYIRALEAMPSIDWTKIFISYVDLMNTPKTRQAELEYTYYFLCQCASCTEPDKAEFMTSAACPNKDCDAFINTRSQKFLSEKTCPSCRTKVSQDHIAAFAKVTELSEMHLKNMESVAFLDVCKYCLNKQRGILYRFNLQHVKMLDMAFQSSIDFNQWEDARVFGLELVCGYKKYYGPVHTLLGLLYLKLGKILLFEEQSREALKYLKEAFDILKITHGATSKFLRQQLLPLLEQAKIESDLINK